MNYFEQDGVVYACDDEQVAIGLAEGMTPITEEEAMLITNPPTPAPMSIPLDEELANPTVSQWNALCVAAGIPELQK